MIPRYSLPEMSAVWDEQARLRTMAEIEILAAEAMGELGLIPAEAARQIRAKADFDVDRVSEIEKVTHHDVIALVSCLAEKVGPEGRFLHLGMTSSDVLDTALAVQMKRSLEILIAKTDRLIGALKKQALKYRNTPMIGRTHGIHAEPVTFGLKLALFYDEFRRNRARLELALPEVAVGKISGAVGTYAHLSPQVEEIVCAKLGLTPAPTSSQIIPRDRHGVLLCRLAIVGASLDRLATEIRHLQRTEVGEAGEPFQKGQKGSSAMPHKRNPILCERISGMSRLLRGYASAALENIPLWHERDISHSSVERVILPDACLALDYMLDKAAWIVENLVVNPARMKANLEASGGLWASESVLLALVDKGLPREAAYALVQKNALAAWDHGKPFAKLLAADPKVKKHLSAGEIQRLFDLKRALRQVPTIFRRLGLGTPSGHVAKGGRATRKSVRAR